MIDKREIIEMAGKANLNPHVVEKDYVLGWVLAGIFAQNNLKENWVFKGGTCLKKCFFETYRFSEDLDFTLKDATHLNADFLSQIFRAVSDWIYEQTGIEIPSHLQDFDIYENPRGKISCQGKLSYRGPVSPTSGLPRIKLDLTADECIVLPEVKIPVIHPYSDEPKNSIEVLSYAYEEAFAEKIRALAERTRPRDLYDVINLYRNIEARPSAALLRDVLRQKCDYKGIPVPKNGDFDDHKNNLESAWNSMLGHQLPALPPVKDFWDMLPEFFTWLQSGISPHIPDAYLLDSGEHIIRERTFSLPIANNFQSFIEIIRFAAANRLCVNLSYQNSTRTIEPYSLRRTKYNNIILRAWNVNKAVDRNYRIDRIQNVNVTNKSFSPRRAVELAPLGYLSIPPNEISTRTTSYRVQGPLIRSVRKSSRSAARFGPTYIYQCGMCQKKFRRKKHNSRLNKHKSPSGYQCSGRTGYLVETKYN